MQHVPGACTPEVARRRRLLSKFGRQCTCTRRSPIGTASSAIHAEPLACCDRGAAGPVLDGAPLGQTGNPSDQLDASVCSTSEVKAGTGPLHLEPDWRMRCKSIMHMFASMLVPHIREPLTPAAIGAAPHAPPDRCPTRAHVADRSEENPFARARV